MLLRFKLLIVFLKIFINVTSIVSTSARRMFAPLGEAKPAEAVMALLAGHVHTALIFLNETGAFGTRFAISFQPCNIF